MLLIGLRQGKVAVKIHGNGRMFEQRRIGPNIIQHRRKQTHFQVGAQHSLSADDATGVFELFCNERQVVPVGQRLQLFRGAPADLHGVLVFLQGQSVQTAIVFRMPERLFAGVFPKALNQVQKIAVQVSFPVCLQ